MAPTNSTNIPEGYTTHGVDGLLCSLTNGLDVLTFYAVNYLAHCITVKMYPGEPTGELVMVCLVCLFLPSAGITRAFEAIVRHSKWRKGSRLQKAAFAGALIMVVRTRDWEPAMGDTIRFPFIHEKAQQRRSRGSIIKTTNSLTSDSPDSKDGPKGRRNSEEASLASEPLMSAGSTLVAESTFDASLADKQDGELTWTVASPPWMQQHVLMGHRPTSVLERGCDIHGFISKLPTGYDLTFVPSEAVILPYTPAIKERTFVGDVRWSTDIEKVKKGANLKPFRVASSWNWPKIYLSIFQAIYSSATLFKTNGGQIAVFGYAAPGFTVLPYLIMSLVNLFAQVASTDYTDLFLVHTPEMDEAISRGATFDGVVGSLEVIDAEEDSNPYNGPWLVESCNADSSYTLRNQNSRDYLLKQTDLRIGGRFEGTAAPESQAVMIPFGSKFKRLDDYKDEESDASSLFGGITGKRTNGWIRAAKAEKMRARLSARIVFWVPVLYSAINMVIIGAVSRFKSGQSTPTERAFVMTWILVGSMFGGIWFPVMQKMSAILKGVKLKKARSQAITAFCTLLFWAILFIPAIGGMTVVGQMIVAYGNCAKTSQS